MIRRPRGFKTFRGRIFWFVVPVVGALLVFQGWVNIREQRRLVTAEFIQRGEALARHVAASSELGVFTEDKQFLGASLRGATKDPDVSYVVIHAGDGQVLAEGGPDRAPRLEGPSQRLVANPASHPREVGGKRLIEFLTPIVSEEAGPADEALIGSLQKVPAAKRPNVIGMVRLGMSLQTVESHVAELLLLSAAVTIGFLLFSTTAIYMFSRQMTQPINRLTRQAQKIATGSLDETIPVRSRDEIGQLAHAFNDMTRALQKTIGEKERALADLGELNATLEDRIRVRTAELDDRRRALQRSLEEVRALGEISRAVASSLDLGEVLGTISAHAVRLSGSDACGIFELDVATERFFVVAAYGFDEQFSHALRSASFPGGAARKGPIRLAMNEGHAVEVPDITVADDMALREIYLAAGFKALLAIPMGSNGVSRAMVLYRRDPGVFEAPVVGLLETFASQSRIAIDNARLFKDTEEKGKQLEVASRHKSEFLASVSHELRTPLNAILGFNEMILGGIYGPVPPALQGPLTDVDRSGRHLLGLISDVLDVSKIEAGRMELALTDYLVDDVIDSLRVILRPLAETKGLALLVSVPENLPVMRGDAKRIKQCLMNLAGNALKFTAQGSVAISVEVLAEKLLFRVSDTGMGIAPDQLPHLFTAFRQADATVATTFGGTGLGLTITKQFVEMHGGRIWAESEPGKGSTFSFMIPMRVEGGPAA